MIKYHNLTNLNSGFNNNKLLILYKILYNRLMKIKCRQKDLAFALNLVNRAVSPNTTLPVLNNILIRA